jgi:hypothetical protein
MPIESQITKSFETVPSYELVKHNTINLIMQITTRLGEMNKYQLLGRNDRMTSLGFVADILTFYSFLRPKILDHIQRKNDRNLADFVNAMDTFILRPSRFNKTYAILAFTELNLFCEKYRLTSTTIYRSPLDSSRLPTEGSL